MRAPLKTSFRYLIYERLSDPELSDSETGKGLLSTTWIRWLLFVLSPLPQVIRLASFQGTRWTKVFGFIYVLSWLSVEILIFLVPTDALFTGPSRWLARGNEINQLLERVEKRALFVGIACTLVLPPVCLHVSYIWPLILGLDHSFVASFKEGWLLIVWIISLVFLIGYYLLIGEFFGFIFQHFATVGCYKYPTLSTNLMIMFPARDGGSQVDKSALDCFLIFILYFIFLVLFYAFLYNSSGTVNPGWTGVFG